MNLSLAAGRAALKLKKHSPAILFGAGIVGMTGTVVLACKATLTASSVHDNHKQAIAKADAHLKTPGNNYGKEEHKRHVVQIWTATSVAYAKLYGPAFILGVTSIACLTKSHQILASRNTALMAAYTGLDSAFKKYRQRVVAELGEEKDTEFAHGKAEEGAHTGYDEKGNGKVTKTKKAPKDAASPYGRWFDETNRHWDKDPGYNHTFLDNQQKWCNILLKKKGHLFLNEVYDLLGMERTQEGQEVGWYYDTEVGDGYVDFGFNRYPDFVAGFERSVYLDFNVDGPILRFL
jgi:hypothetical protein